MGKLITAKFYPKTHKLLITIQKALPGKPTLVSLTDEAIKLLAEKYLKKEES